jgi:hypothetical protein
MRQPRTLSSLSVLPFLVTAWLATACGSEVTELEDDGGTTSAGGSEPIHPEDPVGPGGSEPQRQPTMSAHAPTQFTIEITYNMEPPAELLDAGSYSISGEYGGVDIEEVRTEGAHVVVLETSKQKLGVDYSLDVEAEGDWGDLAETFPSADTAMFWAVDLADPAFSEFQITADRKTVGDNVVIYVEQGWSANNVPQTVDYFDGEVFPIETSLFNDAPDRDENDRVLLLGLNGKGAYGGYYSNINTLTNEEALSQWGYHSNETEMLYVNVETGEMSQHVVAHEFSHLLYAEREVQTFGEDWAWHNEGMAECAVHAVEGNNDYDAWYYTEDPQGGIRSGPSLINWQYANFDQYVLSYMFLSYLAGQKDGVSTFGELFDLSGRPSSVEAWTQQNLGVSFTEAHQRQLLATWAQEPSGIHSYNGMVSFAGSPPVGTGAFTLEPFSGAFRQPASPVSYPGTQGPDIVYVGIDGLNTIDVTEPFDLSGGGLLVFNTSANVNNLSPQPTGNPMPAHPGEAASFTAVAEETRFMTLQHPPPFHPERAEQLRRWQSIAHAR